MRKLIVATLLVGYLLVLLDLTLLRFPRPGTSPNLIPFETIRHDLRAGGREMWVNLVGNLAAFVPLGLLLPPLGKRRPSALRIALLAIALSAGIESLQYLSGRRAADVDDVVLNTLGALLGYLAWRGSRPFRPSSPSPARSGDESRRATGHIVLMGDSIFDNAAYVGAGPAVIDQVRERLPAGWEATSIAVDGSTIGDAMRQLGRLPGDASHLIVGVGGAAALDKLGVLRAHVDTVGEAIRLLAKNREQFDREYARLMGAIAARALPAVVCTISSPRFPNANLQREAIAALCLFNDGILRAAHRSGCPVLDLRALCTEDGDYASLIEPSATGGAKIARAIVDVVLHHGFTRGEAVIFPRAAPADPGEGPAPAPSKSPASDDHGKSAGAPLDEDPTRNQPAVPPQIHRADGPRRSVPPPSGRSRPEDRSNTMR